MSTHTQRITELELAIREGQMRLGVNRQSGKRAIVTAINNARIRIARLSAGLPEGGMIWDGQGWKYEFAK